MRHLAVSNKCTSSLALVVEPQFWAKVTSLNISVSIDPGPGLEPFQSNIVLVQFQNFFWTRLDLCVALLCCFFNISFLKTTLCQAQKRQ